MLQNLSDFTITIQRFFTSLFPFYKLTVPNRQSIQGDL